MILSINQPAYIPWLGYFDRIAASDVHVILDHVQFEKNSFTNRNRLLAGTNPAWLTVPVATKGRFGNLPINEVEIDNRRDWRSKHWRTISQNYRKCRYFDEYAPGLEAVYAKDWDHLFKLVDHMRGLFMEWLGLATQTVYSSALKPQESKSALIVEICRQVGADIYLSGALGRDYLDEAAFIGAEVRLAYQDYVHPVYAQAGMQTFCSNLGILDLLFNHGPDSLSILHTGQAPE